MVTPEEERRPIECVYENERFRVTGSRGSTLSSGGYGYILGKAGSLEFTHHLFAEEVLFLFERGMLRAYDDDKQLNLQDLYRYLEICHIPLYVSLVYQHLKAQTFRVVRCSPQPRYRVARFRATWNFET